MGYDSKRRPVFWETIINVVPPFLMLKRSQRSELQKEAAYFTMNPKRV